MSPARRATEWKRFRRKNLLTQRSLAEVLGITPQTVKNIEHCKYKEVSVRVLSRFEALKQKYAVSKQKFSWQEP